MIRFGFWIAFFVLSWPLLAATSGRSWPPPVLTVSYDVPSFDRPDDEFPNMSAREGQVSHAETERAPNHGNGDRGNGVAYGWTDRPSRCLLSPQLVEPFPPLCEWLPYDATAPPPDA